MHQGSGLAPMDLPQARSAADAPVHRHTLRQRRQGNQYRCAVEYAPLQKMPTLEAKPHPLEGTIDQGTYVAYTACTPATL